MDCDQVFMTLTRGPFPTGDPTDELVEEHLENCGDCWRLAEALRPALEVFQEAVPPIEGRDLPGYWGDARPSQSASSRLTSTAARLAPARNLQTVLATNGEVPERDPESWFIGEMLPAMFTASLLTAILMGLIAWMRA